MPQEWYVRVGNEEAGPLTLQELFVRCRTDQLEPKSPVRSSDGNGKWRHAENVDEILFGDPEELREARRNVLRSPNPDLDECYWNEVFERVEESRSYFEGYSSSTNGGSSAKSDDSNNAAVHYGRGLAWLQRDAFDAAITEFTEAVRLDPQLGSAFHARGKAWLKNGDFASAVRDFDVAIRLDPKYALPSAYDIDDILDAIMELHEDSPDSEPSLKSLWADCPLKMLEVLQDRLNPVFDARGLISQQDSGEVHQMNGPDFSVLKKGYRPTTSSYELTELLGKGGFAQVWRADNQRRGRTAAFKFCLNLEKSGVASLQNELSKIQLLDHPGIVKLEEEHLDAPIPFLQYEFIDGVDLGKFLNQRFAQGGGCGLSPSHAVAVIIKLAEILAHVHSLPKPIVHRDLKPANILVSNFRDMEVLTALGIEPDVQLTTLKVMDFGLAGHSKQAGLAHSSRLSQSAKFDGWGSNAYMSPQQRKGGTAHTSDDIFAIGMIWYQLLKGEMGSGLGSGIKWYKEMKGMGITAEQLDVLADCLEEERANRIPNAVILCKRIRAAYQLEEPQGLFDQVWEAIKQEAGCKNVTTISAEMAEFLAKNGLGNFSSLTSLPANVAQSLVSSSTTETLNLKGLADLSVESAQALSKFKGQNLGLSGLTTLKTEIAQALAEWKGRFLALNGLTTLTTEVAQALAEWKGRFLALKRLSLNGLTTLLPEVAQALAQWKGDTLSLNGLMTLPPEVAQALAEWKGQFLVLNGLTTLPPEVAQSLLGFNGSLELHGLTKVCPEVGDALMQWRENGNRLLCDGLPDIAKNSTVQEKELDDELLEIFSPSWTLTLSSEECDRNEEFIKRLTAIVADVSGASAKWDGGTLVLVGISQITPIVAQTIAEWHGQGMSLSDVTKLTSEAAQALAEWKGQNLGLNGLTKLTPEAAQALSEWGGKYLDLGGLTSLTPEVVEALADWEGMTLHFDGLTIISLAVAQALAKWRGDFLNLDGLKTLAPTTAEALAVWSGDFLSFEGLTKLTPEAAQALSEWGGKYLDLGGLTSLTPEVAESLARWKGHTLQLWSVTTLSPEVAQALSEFMGDDLRLDNLEPESAKMWERIKKT